MANISPRVPPGALRALLAALRHATLAYVDPAGALHALPVAFRWSPERVRVGLARSPRPSGLGAGAAVALCADAGFFWWELRALLVRGALAAGASQDDGSELEWLELVPRTSTAWDYGELHEEEPAAAS
jgi:hypothetical protein